MKGGLDMNRNVGGTDRAVRLVAGAALLLLGLLAPVGTGARAVIFVIAAVAFVTAFTGF
jgi:hypothetical protein